MSKRILQQKRKCTRCGKLKAVCGFFTGGDVCRKCSSQPEQPPNRLRPSTRPAEEARVKCPECGQKKPLSHFIPYRKEEPNSVCNVCTLVQKKVYQKSAQAKIIIKCAEGQGFHRGFLQDIGYRK